MSTRLLTFRCLISVCGDRICFSKILKIFNLLKLHILSSILSLLSDNIHSLYCFLSPKQHYYMFFSSKNFLKIIFLAERLYTTGLTFALSYAVSSINLKVKSNS